MTTWFGRLRAIGAMTACAVAAAALPACELLEEDLAKEGGSEPVAASSDLWEPREIPSGEIELSSSIAPIRASANMMPAGITHRDRLVVSGFGEFTTPPIVEEIARNLRIEHVYVPEGTESIILDVSRGAAADIFDADLKLLVAEGDTLALVDSHSNRYSPIGYLHEKGDDKNDLRMAPGTYLRTMGELPYLPTAGTQRLRLYFRVTAGVRIVRFQLGEITVATCELDVPG